MNRLFEYLYLVAGLAVLIAMAVRWESLNWTNRGIMLVMVALCAGIYSARRQRRILREQQQRQNPPPSDSAE